MSALRYEIWNQVTGRVLSFSFSTDNYFFVLYKFPLLFYLLLYWLLQEWRSEHLYDMIFFSLPNFFSSSSFSQEGFKFLCNRISSSTAKSFTKSKNKWKVRNLPSKLAFLYGKLEIQDSRTLRTPPLRFLCPCDKIMNPKDFRINERQARERKTKGWIFFQNVFILRITDDFVLGDQSATTLF